MKQIRILFLLAIAISMTSLATAKKYWDPPSGQGVSTVGTGGDYATLAAAAADYNTTAPLGDWKMEIISSTTEPANVGFGKTTNGHKVLIKPASGVTPIITFTQTADNAGPSGHLVIGSVVSAWAPIDCSNFEIDGSNTDGGITRDLTLIDVSTSSFQFGIRVVGPSLGVTIKNSIITTLSTSGSSSVYAVLFTVRNPGNTCPDNGVIDNCAITAVSSPLAQAIAVSNSGTITAGVAVRNLTVRNCDIYARTRGIFMNYGVGAQIYNNNISVSQSTAGYSSFGIWQYVANGAYNWTMNIYNNKFWKLESAATATANGIVAIDISGGPSSQTSTVTYNVYNNTIGGFASLAASGLTTDLTFVGIRGTQSSASKYNIYNNSINIPAISQTTGSTEANLSGILMSGTITSPGAIVIKNNIVSVAQPGGVAINRRTANTFTTSDNNDVYAVGTAFFGRWNTISYATLSAWNTATSKDANSKELNPAAKWVSASDLHFNGLPGSAWKFGADVSAISYLNKDIDAADRDVVQPYVGADEPVAPNTTLTVASLYGNPAPAIGVSNTTSGTLLNASVEAIVAGPAGTQYVCTGYTGTGSAPSGVTNSVSFTITDPSTLTWNWKTQYQLTTAVAPAGAGSVTGAGWFDASASAPVSATANGVYLFGNWSGGLTGSTNPDSVVMDAAKTVTANFTNADINLPVAVHNFGLKKAGSAAADQNIQIQNLGSHSLTISSAYRASGSADFSVVSCPATVAVNTTETMVVRYTPNTVGNLSAVINIMSDSLNETTTTLSLTGQAAAPSALVTTPDGTDWGFRVVGSGVQAATKRIVVTNTGLVPLTISATGEAGSAEITKAADIVGDVAPGASVTIIASYNPVTEGVVTKTFTINSDDPAAPAQNVVLQGTGAKVGVIPDDFAFGFVKVGETPKISAVVTNDSAQDTTFTVSLAAPFSVVGSSSILMPAHTTATLQIQYAPAAVASASAASSLVSSNPGLPNLPITASGRGWSKIHGKIAAVNGAVGGTVQVEADGDYTNSKVVIPAGAFVGTHDVTIQEPTDQHGKDNAVEVLAPACSPAATVTVEFQDADFQVGPGGAGAYQFVGATKWDGAAFAPIASGAAAQVSPGVYTVPADQTSFSIFSTETKNLSVSDWNLY